eukprot:7388631-Prymnesium_polylepis.1
MLILLRSVRSWLSLPRGLLLVPPLPFRWGHVGTGVRPAAEPGLVPAPGPTQRHPACRIRVARVLLLDPSPIGIHVVAK